MRKVGGMIGWASLDEQHFITASLKFIRHAFDCDAETMISKVLCDGVKIWRRFAVEGGHVVCAASFPPRLL